MQEIAMETVLADETVLHARDQLLHRRERLEGVIAKTPEPRTLAELLREVDAALGRIEDGTFGVCEVCHGTVEADRIAVDPLLRTCLTCLSAAEQRALERDLDLAGHVQRTLLPPQVFHVNGWEGGYRYKPAGSASGDYVDLLPLESNELIFLIGDVSGKGLAASLLMTHLHAILRSLVALRLPFQDLMEQANRIFYESMGGNQYVTLLCGKASHGGQIEISNAGHCPPIVLRDGSAAALPPMSVPIGLFAKAPFPTVQLTLDVGESLLLYTDGITEATDAAGREYGRDRLLAAVRSGRESAVAEIVSRCVDEVERFRGDGQRDDMTLFMLKRRA
jgi:sigma-B regulation protein RsbU (phosphoserine phosphatase)